MAKSCSCGCNGPVWSKGLCKREWSRQYGKPLKRSPLKSTHTPIKAASSKLVSARSAYSAKRPKWFEDHPDCELRCCPECRGVATDIHHLQGREGELLLDSSKWKSACRPCHDWVKDNSKKAMELGLILPRNTSIR